MNVTKIPCLNPTLLDRTQMRDLVSYARNNPNHPHSDGLAYAADVIEKAPRPGHDPISQAAVFLTGTQRHIDAAFDFSWAQVAR